MAGESPNHSAHAFAGKVVGHRVTLVISQSGNDHGFASRDRIFARCLRPVEDCSSNGRWTVEGGGGITGSAHFYGSKWKMSTALYISGCISNLTQPLL